VAAPGARRLPDGSVRVRLRRGERELLAALGAQLAPIVRGDEGPAALRSRLFPPAAADPAVEAAYRELVGDNLEAERLGALETFIATLERGTPARGGGWRIELDPDQAAAWLSVVNDARLVLAGAVGITTEADWEAGPEPDDPTTVALYYLGWLEEELVDALTGSLGASGNQGEADTAQ
jgi:hypothetical protein